MSLERSPVHTLPAVRHFAVASVFLLALTFTACSDSTPAATPSQDEASRERAGEFNQQLAADQSTEVFLTPDEMPSPIGGMQAIASAIQYPASAKEAGIEGRVLVTFVVEPDGTVRDAAVAKGVDAELDAEALRVVSASTWTPGTLEGKGIPTQLTLPVTFKLQ